MSLRDVVYTHESGHAVVGHLLGLEEPPTVVTFGDSGHVLRYNPVSWEVFRMSRAEWREFSSARAMAALAGEAALVATGYPDHHYGAALDWRRARSWADRLGPDPDAEVQRLFRLTVGIARAKRPAIEAFARELAANYGRLAGREVIRALEAATGRRRTPGFRAIDPTPTRLAG